MHLHAWLPSVVRAWGARWFLSGAIVLALAHCTSSDMAATPNAAPSAGGQPASGEMAVPAAAAQVGYTIHTFSSTFTAATVDRAGTQSRGFQWYNWNLFGTHSDPSAVVINSDGSVTLNGDTTGAGGELVTAVQHDSAEPFVGSSFGGGAYIEATFKWQPLRGSSAKLATWPAFWAMGIEGHMAPYSSQWPGQAPGYIHNIEADFFEALPVDAGTNTYGGSMHDWYGIYAQTCAPQECEVKMPFLTGQRVVPEDTDFTQYHRYGFLWVPATRETKGYAQFFFDGVQLGYSFKWEMLGDQPPPPTNQPWAFGVLDQQHLFFILGTGQGQPMTVQSVDVWQAGTSANITN